MIKNTHFKEFEKIVTRLLELLGYKFELIDTASDSGFDLIAVKKIKYYVQLKFYRSRNVTASFLKETANKLAFYLNQKIDSSALIVINTLVPRELKNDILKQYGIQIWDREVIYNHLTELSIELRDSFEQLLLSAQQGTDTYDVFSGIEIENVLNPDYLLKNADVEPRFKVVPTNKGKKLCNELSGIKCGRDEWSQYENKCFEILKFLFHNDLSLWERQNKTEDGLSRFDLICRIASNDDYWKALVSSFNTRFVLFEFKNYCDKIDQGQIYTTERYLYNKGLRSVAFIIARNGASENAITAAKGALKENGKLILLLSNKDLCEMLKLKDNNESPNDYLSNLLDSWLISLSR